MKSLILKDLYNIGHNMKSMLLILPVMAVWMTSFGGVGGFVVAAGAMCGTMVMTSFSFDHMSQWPRYAMIMPVSRRDLVASKFLVLLIFAAAGSVAGLALGVGGGLLLHKLTPDPESLGTLLLSSLAGFLYAAVCGSLSIPLVLRFGAERARVLMLASFMAPAAVFIGGYQLLERLGVRLTEEALPVIFWVGLAVAVGWMAVMYRISCAVFSRQEL